MAINQGDNGGGNPSNGQTKFTSLPPAERVNRLHKALMSDEFYSGIITNDFNAFVDEFSQPERMRELHNALSQDEVFSEFVPKRYEDAIEWMGFTTAPEPMGKPLPTTQNRSGRGGVDSGVGSQSGLQSSSQRRITVDDIGVTGVGGTEPEFNYEVDRQDAEEQSESLRQQRINQGVNQINILVNAAGREGRSLIEKGLSEGLSQREYQKLYDVLEGTQFRDYISQVNPMTDFVSPNAFRQIFADGITAGGSGVDYSTATKRGDFDKLSEQANAEAVNQWLSGFDSRMQDKVGDRAYRAATEQARSTYGEKAEAVINNTEGLIARQSISEEERAAADLVRELNDLVGSGRELNNEELARAAELDRRIKTAEVELGKMGTLYDPITGQFIPQMRAPEFAAEVSQREEELSEVKDLDLLKDMRRRAYFAYAEYRKKAGDKDFLYEWIPGQDVEVDRMRAAWKEFSALNRVIELNIDPATIGREGENLGALRTGFMGSPSLESNRSVVEGVVDAFRRSGLTPTKEQEERLQKSFGEQAFESLGASTNIMLKMAAEMALTRGMRGALGLNSYTNAFRRALSATRLGAKAPKAVSITSKILGGALDVAQSGLIFEGAGQNFATGAGEEIAQKVVDLFTKGKAGRLIKLLSGSVGETFAEYLGELTNEISELGIENLDEAFRETFGRNPESAMDKLLLTLATIAPFAGVSAIGREFTDSVERYAESQPDSDVKSEVLGIVDVLKAEAEKKKGGAVAAVGGAATTAAPEAAPAVAPTTVTETTPSAAQEATPEPAKSPVTVSSALDGSAQVERNGVTGTLTLDGQTIVFEHSDGKTIEDVGNVDEISASSISDFGFNEVQRIDLEVNPETMPVVIDGVEYVNNYSKPDAAINTDANGDVVSVTLETKDGKKRTFRGERAQEIAYQYKLIEFEKNATEEQIQSALERVRQIAETTAGNVQDTGQGQASDTQGTQSEGVTTPVTQAAPVTTVTPTPTTNPALADVESTAKALEGEIENHQAIAEAYHAGKSKPAGDRSSGEAALIEAVEKILSPKVESYATQEQGAAPLFVGDGPEVSEEVRGQDTEGGEVAGEGEVKTKEGEPTKETEPVEEGKVAKIIEELRSDPNVTEVHVSGNDIVYVKKDKNGKPRYYEKIGGGRSNQLSKTDFEFKREIAMDNATSINEAGIPLDGEPAFLEGEDQTSLNVLDSAPVVTSEGTLPESTEDILEQEESESETLTEQEVDNLYEDGGLRLTAITTMSPEQKKSAKQKADERYEASKKKLRESWKDFSAKARSANITPTPQSQKAQFDAMLKVFADVAVLAKDWALRKALSGADLSKLTYFDFKRENRDIFSDSAARVKVGSRFFDKGEDSYASLAFDQGLAMALDPTHQMETPAEKTGSEVLDDVLAKGQKQSKNAFNFGDFSSKALASLASAFDYNASLKNSIIDLSNRIKNAGMKSFSVREFFERLQFAAQPGSKIQLKYDQFRRAVYGGLSQKDKRNLDAIILFRSVISLEKAISERRAKIAEFENNLVANYGFDAKTLERDLNDYAAGRSAPKGLEKRVRESMINDHGADAKTLDKNLRDYAAGLPVPRDFKDKLYDYLDASGLSQNQFKSIIHRIEVGKKIDAYLKSTGQTKAEFKSKIRSIEGKREANKGIGGDYQHPKGLTLELAQGSLEAAKNSFGQEAYDDLQKRADAYFDFNRSLLLDRLNAGQISQYLYDEIVNREYVPRIWDDSELVEEFANNPAYGGYDFGVDSNKGGYIGIKRLKGGSSKTEEAVIESDLLMKINTAMAVQAIENHRLMQFVINDLVPTSDAYVNLLIEEAIKKNGGKPISASEERKIRRSSQIVYELNRTGTAKDGKPKFEPPLDGFVEFVFSDGNTTRAFAALESPGGGNFLSNMRMSKKGKKASNTVIKRLMGVALIKFTAVAANPSFAAAQLLSMDVMHQMMVTPGVKFVPWAFLRRVVLGSSKVAGKAYERAIFKNRVLFSKLFSKQRPTPELTAFEKQLEDAIAHGLDFSGGILGEKKYSFDDKSKFGENFKKFISFLEEGIRDTELATRLTSYETLVARKMKAKKREVKRDLTDDEISEIKRSAAYDISNVLNYYNRGAVSEAADAWIPFFSAAVNAMKAHARFLPGKLGRIGGGEPMTSKQKAVYLANVGQFIGGAVMLSLYMFAKDEEDERNGVIPAGANGHKDALIIPLWVTEDDNGKKARAFISLPLDKMMGGYNLVGKRIAQDLYYGSEDTWTRGNRPQYPVKSPDILKKFFYETIPGVGSLPPLASGAAALVFNYDLYRWKEIYRSQGGTPDPENMADERTRAIFRVLSRFTKGVVDLPAKQLETAFGKVVSLNNPFSNLLTTAFAQIAPEDLRGEGETLEGIMKSGTGRLYGVSRRAALEEGETEVSIAVGNIGADMASDQVGMVFDELSRVPANKRAANAPVFADAVSKKASAIKSDNRGFSTSSQVNRLKKSNEVDYELGEEILDAYKAGNPSVVNDLMSLPDSHFGQSSYFYLSLAGGDNENAGDVGRIIYARRREQSKDIPTIGSLARGFRERLKGMGIDGADGQGLAEALAKLSVESDKRNAKKK